MSTPVWAWIQFLACAALIGAAGSQLSRYGDAIAQHTGLSGSWIGLTLVASVTSLPELATGIYYYRFTTESGINLSGKLVQMER